MTQPDTGVINRQWVVETYTNVVAASAGAVLSSRKLTVVSEAYPISMAGTVAGPYAAGTIVAHGGSTPAGTGSIQATIAATLGPQQFTAQVTLGGTLLTAGTVLSATFLERGY